MIDLANVRRSQTNLVTIARVAGCRLAANDTLRKFARKRLPYWLPAILTVVLMLDTVTQCQIWGAVPQLQIYFFPLLASIFLVLSAYYKTVFAAKQTGTQKLAFCSQGALFFCCLSLNTAQWPLYLGMKLRP